MCADTSSSAVLSLPSGRELAYSVTGPPDGSPVIYCHGAIGTPVAHSVDLAAITAELDVLHVAVSRPGIGGSDGLSGRRVVDFAADVRRLADALGIERFSVVGVSAGGPYALAAAHQLADRVNRIALCSSMAPMCPPHRSPDVQRRVRLALRLVAESPELCAELGDIVLPVLRRRPRLVTRLIAAHAAASEQARLRTPQEQSAAASSFLEATAHGVRGMIDDYGVVCGDWGFAPSEVETEVQLWHGVRDPLVPIEHALQLAISLPHCRVFFDPDEGHHFFRARLRTILDTLTRDADRPATAYRPRPV